MYQFTLPDMSCGHCVSAITEALTASDAKARVDIDRDAKTVRVDSALSRETLTAALAGAGYPPAPEPAN